MPLTCSRVLCLAPVSRGGRYCSEGSLLDKLNARTSYPPITALRWVHDVAKGMEYLHSSGVQIAHRDLKPENILLANGVAKVADFGLARLVFAGEQLSGEAPARQAAAPLLDAPHHPHHPHHGHHHQAAPISQAMGPITEGVPAGAPGTSAEQWTPTLTGKTGSCRYMAPEVWAARDYDLRADVYSFAVLAYEVLSKRRAYSERYMTMEQVAAAATRDPAFRPRIPRTWPAPLAELLGACWHAEPAKRPPFWEVVGKLDLLTRAVDAASGLRPGEGDEQVELGEQLLRALRDSPHLSSCCAIA